METEVRFYYSLEEKEKVLNYFQKFKELKYLGKFYECTDQYNHPMKDYDFYSDEIDGRFRVRKSIGEDSSKCMISWKRRLHVGETIHREEEMEVSISPEDYENLCFLLVNVLHLYLLESYERYRHIFQNKEVEVVVDEYPFGLCVEIENKSDSEDPNKILQKWMKKFHFNEKFAYPLSWDDKYEELCREQNKRIEYLVRFDKEMPFEHTPFPFK
ncbi:MAG: hypothetical protein J6X28_05900 [Bacilli bacterium]|nr:hypothetical protein [Bacilli bacterium]